MTVSPFSITVFGAALCLTPSHDLDNGFTSFYVCILHLRIQQDVIFENVHFAVMRY